MQSFPNKAEFITISDEKTQNENSPGEPELKHQDSETGKSGQAQESKVHAALCVSTMVGSTACGLCDVRGLLEMTWREHMQSSLLIPVDFPIKTPFENMGVDYGFPIMQGPSFLLQFLVLSCRLSGLAEVIMLPTGGEFRKSYK